MDKQLLDLRYYLQLTQLRDDFLPEFYYTLISLLSMI